MLDAEEECYLEMAIHQGEYTQYIQRMVLDMQYVNSAMTKSGKRSEEND